MLGADADLGRIASRPTARSTCRPSEQARSWSASRASIAALKDLRWRYTRKGPSGRAAPRRHHQQHRLLVGVGQHVSVQPVPVPLGQPPVPGRAVDRHRHLRGAHAEDGGQLRRRAPRREAAGGRVRRGAGRAFFGAFDWRSSRRGVRPLPAGAGDRRRRRHARHRLPEPVAPPGVGQADPGDGAGHAGLLEHRRPGVHQRLHRPGRGHVAVRRRRSTARRRRARSWR
jgi:hypothetical protein